MKTGTGRMPLIKLAMGGPGDPPNWQTVIGPSGRPIKFDSAKAIPIKGRANKFTIFDEDSLMYYDVDREPVKGSYTLVPSSARFEKELKNTGPVALGDSNKVKSKERFRERASGGSLPYIPIGLPVSPQSIAAQKETFKTSFGEQLSNFASNPVVQSIAGLVPGLGTGLSIAGKIGSTQELPTTPTTAEAFEKVDQKKYNEYAATGGALNHIGGMKTKGDSDIRLSNNAVQVKGNPHMTDGNSYATPGTNVHLDDGEVVRGNMVISNKLTNPMTGKTFAEDAAKKEKLIEKLTKRNSPEDRTTIKRINKDIDELIAVQEDMATKMGLRKTQPDEIMMASGGPVPKDLNVKEFQEWLSKNGVQITVDGKWGAATEEAYKQFKDPYLLRNRTNTLEDLQDISYRMNQTPGAVTTLNDNAERAAAINLRKTVPSVQPLGSNIRMNDSLPYRRDPLTGEYPTDAFSTTPPDISSSRIPAEKVGRDVLFSKLGAIPSFGTPENPIGSPTVSTSIADPEMGAENRGLNITPGTALQGIAATSQLVRSLVKGPANKSYQMTTPISENYYSADQALQQNQSNYAQARNSIDAGSVNVRRAMTNSLYATKLGSDNQVISNTNDMNRAAKIDYENRLSQRQGQNIQLAQYKNELDARDLGAQNNTKDVAFNTMSNFGRALDQQRSSMQTLELLKQMYPDVYGNIEKKKKKDGK